MRRLLIIIPPDNPRSKINALLHNLDAQVDHSQWSICPLLLEENYRSIGFESLLAASDDVDAVIWWYANPEDEIRVRSMVQSGHVLVTYNRDFPAAGAMAVVADVREVARMQFQRLWDMGKRRFAAVSVDRPSPSISQFVRTIEELALQREEECDFRKLTMPYAPIHRPTPQMLEAVSGMMDGWPAPDAVMCAEIFSYHAMESWLASRPHVRVPEDVAIATFDNVQRPNVLRLKGHIPNARHDDAGMIRAAMEMIERRLSGEDDGERMRRIPAMMVEPEPIRNVA